MAQRPRGAATTGLEGSQETVEGLAEVAAGTFGFLSGGGDEGGFVDGAEEKMRERLDGLRLNLAGSHGSFEAGNDDREAVSLFHALPFVPAEDGAAIEEEDATDIRLHTHVEVGGEGGAEGISR